MQSGRGLDRARLSGASGRSRLATRTRCPRDWVDRCLLGQIADTGPSGRLRVIGCLLTHLTEVAGRGGPCGSPIVCSRTSGGGGDLPGYGWRPPYRLRRSVRWRQHRPSVAPPEKQWSREFLPDNGWPNCLVLQEGGSVRREDVGTLVPHITQTVSCRVTTGGFAWASRSRGGAEDRP